jgi:hypothetical protein
VRRLLLLLCRLLSRYIVEIHAVQNNRQVGNGRGSSWSSSVWTRIYVRTPRHVNAMLGRIAWDAEVADKSVLGICES